MKKLITFVSLFFIIALPFRTVVAEPLPSNVSVITPSDIISRIEESKEPFALFVFTTWCPYCKKQMAELSKLSAEQRKAMPPLLAVSIDADPHAYSRFTKANAQLPIAMKLYQGNASIESILHPYGSDFNGGIPYIAVFSNKKIIKQFNGVTAPENLLQSSK